MVILLCDGDILLHRACSVSTTTLDWGDGEVGLTVNVKKATSWIRRELAQLEKRLGASRSILALGDRTANFRKELCPSYKAHRNHLPKPPGFLEVEALVKMHLETVSEPRLEGDDLLGLLATKGPADGKVVVSTDKDLRSIPCTLYNPDRNILGVIDEEAAHYAHLFQTLVGDRVDGYPGCPGVGPVKAAKILAGDVETLWERIESAFEAAGQTEEQALLQARLAFVLRQGFYDRKKKEVRLWTPE